MEAVWSKDGVNLAETVAVPKMGANPVAASPPRRKAPVAQGAQRPAWPVAAPRDVREEGLGDAAAAEGSDLAFEELAAFVKTPGRPARNSRPPRPSSRLASTPSSST